MSIINNMGVSGLGVLRPAHWAVSKLMAFFLTMLKMKPIMGSNFAIKIMLMN